MSTIIGTVGNDSLTGDANPDSISGLNGNDTLVSSGYGQYYGDDGNDYIYAGSGGGETLDGGAGTDWLNTTSFSSPYRVNLANGQTNFTFESFVNFENIYSGSGNDTLYGTTGANTMYGNAGNDWIFGDAGNDSI